MAVSVNPSLHALMLDTELATALNLTYTSLSDAQRDHLRNVINGVSAAVRNYLRTNVIRRSVTEYHDGGGRSIFVDNAPIYTADSANYPITVLENGDTLTPAADGSDKTAGGATPDFYLIPELGQFERNGTWLSGRRIVKITYAAGRAWQYKTGTTVRTLVTEALSSISYDSGAEAIWEAARILCKWAMDVGNQQFGSQFTETGVFIRTTSAWPKAALDILDYYRRMSL